jgi:hypothetical protein
MGIIFRNGIIDLLKERKTLIKRPKIFEELLIGAKKYDSELEDMLNEKYKEWISRGVPEKLAIMGKELAREWTESMTRFGVAGAELPDEVIRKIAKEHLKKGIEVAERWVKKMGGI